ncbi:MAG: hypothetical protein ACSHX9_16975 [Luteolibacter sp.]
MQNFRLLAITIGLALSSFVGAQTRTVDITAEGRYYNEVWKSWSPYPIRVYVDKEANVYLSGGDKLIGASGYISKEKWKPLIDGLKKGQEWAKKAKEAELETTKEIATFFTPYDTHEQGVSLTFFTANKGEQTDVILKIQDFDNMFTKIELYLNPEQVAKLIKVLEKVPETLKELREGGNKADEILK